MPLPADAECLMDITARPDVVMTRGAGSYLFDEHGRRYLDFIQGWAVNSLGHCPPEVRDALVEQSDRLVAPSPSFYSPPLLALARRLTDLSGLPQVFFTNSGAEANEGAIKLCRKWGKRHRGGAFEIVTAENAFHGRTLATMAASGKPGWDALFPPPVAGFSKVRFGDRDAMARAISSRTVALMVEPIQGEAGVVVPPPGYLRSLRALADEHNLLLVLDEVQTGIGRTGALFAFEDEGIRPDVLTVGKGLGSGVPIGALLATRDAACFEHGDQGGTFNGNPLMTAVGKRVLDAVAEPTFLANVRRTGEHLQRALHDVGPPGSIVEVRGRGLLWALVLSEPAAPRIRDVCMERGLLINAPRPNALRFMPSLRVSADEIDEMATTLREAIAEALVHRFI